MDLLFKSNVTILKPGNALYTRQNISSSKHKRIEVYITHLITQCQGF